MLFADNNDLLRPQPELVESFIPDDGELECLL